MKSINYIFLLPIFVLFVSCQNQPKGEDIVLRLKYNLGDEHVLTYTTTTKGSPEMSVWNLTEVKFKVTSIDDPGIYNMQVDLLKIQSETDFFGEKESYDSEKDESLMNADEKSMHAEFKSALHSEFRLSINERGDIVKTYTDENGLPAEGPLDMNVLQLKFPEEKVNIGSEWNGERMAPVINQPVKSTYTLKKITDTEITIAVESAIPGLGGMLKPSIQKGEYVLDKTTCQLKSGKLSMDLQTGGKAEMDFYTSK